MLKDFGIGIEQMGGRAADLSDAVKGLAARNQDTADGVGKSLASLMEAAKKLRDDAKAVLTSADAMIATIEQTDTNCTNAFDAQDKALQKIIGEKPAPALDEKPEEEPSQEQQKLDEAA